MAFGFLVDADETNGATLADLGLSNPLAQVDALYIQDEDGLFDDRAPQWGADDRDDGRSIVTADLNNDGYLDLIKMSRVLLSRCGDDDWLRVRLHGPGANPDAVGARLELSSGDTLQTRWIDGGSTGHASSGPPEAHFGLGVAGDLQLTVHWPDGATSVIEDLTARTIVVVSRDDATTAPPPIPLPSL